METRSLQDLVSIPGGGSQKSPKQNLLSSYLQRAAKLQRWVRVRVLCAVCLGCWSWARLKDLEKSLPWILSMRVVSRLRAHCTTPTRLYSIRFPALPCFYFSRSSPLAQYLSSAPQPPRWSKSIRWSRPEARPTRLQERHAKLDLG